MKKNPEFISGIIKVTGYIMIESNEILKHQQLLINRNRTNILT